MLKIYFLTNLIVKISWNDQTSQCILSTKTDIQKVDIRPEICHPDKGCSTLIIDYKHISHFLSFLSFRIMYIRNFEAAKSKYFKTYLFILIYL